MQGEKLTKMAWNYDDEDTSELSYSGKSCKGYLPIMVWSVDDLRPLLEAHPELAGMRCNQLPDKIYSKDEIDETTEQYTYTFDKDGYVESCTEVSTYKRLDNNETRTETTIYTFTWEQSSETVTNAKSQPIQLRISWLFSVLNKHLINYKTMCFTSIFIDAENTKQ